MSFLINSYWYVSAGCSGDLISLSGLQAYYKLDENGNDSSGNGYNSTSSTDPVYGTGVFNQAWSGATTFRNLILPAGLSTVFKPYQMTLVAWVKMPPVNTNYVEVFDLAIRTTFSPPTDEFCWFIWNDGNSSRISIGCPGNHDVSYDVGVYLTANTWFHLAVVDKGLNTTTISNYDFYINGVKYAATNRGGSSSFPTTLGNRTGSIGGYSNSRNTSINHGMIDDLSIWNRRLSETEIQTLYNATCPLRS
jgi:hypothetical protein